MTKQIACVFPGQGIKIDYSNGIFKSRYASACISYINDLIGHDISVSTMHSTVDAQLSIILASHLIFTDLAYHAPMLGCTISCVAGHSLGQFSAALAAEIISFKQCVDLVHKRATYMNEYIKNNPGGIMIACIGNDIEDILPEIVHQIDGAYIANYNSHNQVVVSGVFDKKLLEEKCKLKSIRCIQLKVAGPFHSPFMREPNDAFNTILDSTDFSEPKCQYVLNKSPGLVSDLKLIKEDFYDQMKSSVNWTRIMDIINSNSFDTLIEINTSAILSKLTSTKMHNALEYIKNMVFDIESRNNKGIMMTNTDKNTNHTKENSFFGKRLLITGGTGGIGRAIISHLINVFNVEVFFTSTDDEQSQALVQEFPNNIKGYICIDFMDTNAASVIMNEAKKAFSSQKYGITSNTSGVNVEYSKISYEYSPDILINCAGMSKDSLFITLTDEVWDKHMQVNLNVPRQMCQIALRDMLKKKMGRVISISSVVGKVGNPGQMAYASSKAAIEGMTKTLALEVANKCITVNTIVPGFIDTSMTAYLKDASKKKIMDSIISRIPMAKLGRPEDVAIAVEFLVKSDYVTGISLEVSGGMCRF